MLLKEELLFKEPLGAMISFVSRASAVRVALYKGETEAQKGQEMFKAEGRAQINTHDVFQPDSCEG